MRFSRTRSSPFTCLLRAYRDYRGLFEDWGYWAPGKGAQLEVDFMLHCGDDLVAIEVRSGLKVFETDLRGLRAVELCHNLLEQEATE